MENKEEKIKKAEKLAEERAGNNLLNFIIAKTFSRHSQMTEEEFLKDIGFEGSGKTEDEAIRIATFNVITETMNQLIRAKESLKTGVALMKTYLFDEKVIEEDKKEDKKGE